MSDFIKQIINPIPSATTEIGIDTSHSLINGVIGAAQIGSLNLGSLTTLTQSAQNREQVYQLIDDMSKDSMISSVLKTYCEDTVQTNDRGQIMWIEADDSKILNYTTWLMDSLNVEKHLYQWTYCLVTYGDVYLRLFRNSDIQEDPIFDHNKRTKQLNESRNSQEPLNEAQLRIYSNSDRYIPYVQMVSNPGEMFDLQKFGKTHGFIKTPIQLMQSSSDDMYSYLTKYKANQSDVEIYDAMSFVHGCLDATSQRQPETIDIFLTDYNIEDDDNEIKDSMTSSYEIKRGQSILYNAFKSWRELNLLEMSALLNRLTRSSIVRVLNIDVGDMPGDQVEIYLRKLKDKFEQKAALKVDGGMSEYTNPGPVENTIYVPVYQGHGQISVTSVGGDFDPKSLIDLEYFRDKVFGALQVPKQFFGFTDDGAGFNGGSSLTILSSRYGKTVKNLQRILCQLVTDLLNLFMIDRGLDNYVNKFKVRMQEPVTQEELDRRSNNDNRLRYIGDFMQQLDEVDDKVIKLKIYKSLISTALNNNEVIGLLQDYINKVENEEKEKKGNETKEGNAEDELPSLGEQIEEDSEKEVITEEGVDDLCEEEDSYLPSGEELGLNLTESEDFE